MMIRLFLACVIATPAMASCPVGADLASGIRLVQADGTTDDYRALRPGVVETISTYTDGYVARTLLGQGIYVLEVADVVDGSVDPYTQAVFAFRMAASDMPLPDPNTQMKFGTTVRDGGGLYPENIVIDWGDRAAVTYGKCSYAMIPGTFSHTSDDYDHQEVVHYLPELGISVLHSYFDDEMTEADIYPVADIKTIRN